MKTKKSPNDIAVALLLSGFFFMVVALVSLEDNSFEGQTRASSLSAPVAPADVNAMDLVNKHLREVYDQQEMERQNVANINVLTAPPIDPSEVQKSSRFDDIPLVFDEESIGGMVGQDLQSFAVSAMQKRPLSQQIQHEILEDLRRAKEEELYRKALAESIRQSARSKGFEVQIDEDYKIKSIRKIKVKEDPSIFEMSGIPNQ